MQFSLIVNPLFNRMHCWPVEHVQRWTCADDTKIIGEHRQQAMTLERVKVMGA